MQWFANLRGVVRPVFVRDRLAGQATTVAWTDSASAIKIAQGYLFEAIQNGWTFEKFKDDLLSDDRFTSRYYPPPHININWHMETVFRTNLMHAYTQGRLQMYNDPELGDLVVGYRYNAILDDRTRPAHAVMEGRMYPKSHPIWQTWMPPNGYNCRCTIDHVTKFEDYQWSPEPPSHIQIGDEIIPVQPDEDFGRREVEPPPIIAKPATKPGAAEVPSIPVPEPYIEPKTLREAEQLLQRVFCCEKGVSLKGFDLARARAIVKHLYQLHNGFPDAILDRIESSSAKKFLALVRVTYTRGDTRERMTLMLSHRRLHDWIVRLQKAIGHALAETVEDVLNHEWAHVIVNQPGRDKLSINQVGIN